MNFLFEIIHRKNNIIDDVFRDYVVANSLHAAREQLEEKYPSNKGYIHQFIKEVET